MISDMVRVYNATVAASPSASLDQRVAHTDAEAFRSLTAIHGGDGSMQVGALLGSDAPPLELMIVDVARDMSIKNALLQQPRSSRK